MDDEARLMAALAAGGAPRRDPAFTMAVMRATEAERYRAEALRSMLKSGGVAAAIAGLAVPFLGWAAANGQAVENGLLGAASLLVLVVGARLFASRATAMLRR